MCLMICEVLNRCRGLLPVCELQAPLRGHEKEGPSRKNLRHAAGPSCVTSCATVEVQFHTLLPAAIFGDGVKELR